MLVGQTLAMIQRIHDVVREIALLSNLASPVHAASPVISRERTHATFVNLEALAHDKPSPGRTSKDPQDHVDTITKLLARVRVYEDWGFGSKLGKGLGVAAVHGGFADREGSRTWDLREGTLIDEPSCWCTCASWPPRRATRSRHGSRSCHRGRAAKRR